MVANAGTSETFDPISKTRKPFMMSYDLSVFFVCITLSQSLNVSLSDFTIRQLLWSPLAIVTLKLLYPRPGAWDPASPKYY